MKRTLSFSTAAVAAASVSVLASGQTTIVDTSFTAGEGYTDGELRNFATITPNAGAAGTWLGQTGVIVDTSGTGSGSIQGAFRRNHWNQGALGGVSGGTGDTEGGGASHPNPGGFAIGDRVLVETVSSFELDDGTANRALLQQGIRPNFVLGGFESAPAIGAQFAYNPFEDGELKFFTDLTRSGFDGANNPFALFIEPSEVGVDNGFNPVTGLKDLPTDLVSDNIRVTWEAEYTGADTWQATELIVENADTATVLGTASVDAPDALEAITFAGSGSEAFGALRVIRDQPFGTGPIGTIEEYKFVFTPGGGPGGLEGDYSGDGFVSQGDLDLVLLNWGANVAPAGFDENNLPGGGPFDGLMSQNELDGVLLNWGDGTPPALTAVPEPTSLALLGLGGLAMLRRRG